MTRFTSPSLTVSDRTVQRLLQRAGLWSKSKYPVCRTTKYHRNSNYFEKIDSVKKAYWLGFLAADGCVKIDKYGRKYVDLRLSKKDASHLEMFLEDLKAEDVIHHYDNAAVVMLCDKKMVFDLMFLGIVPRKSLILKYPSINSELDKAFMLGYFDGDGCWTKTSGRIKFNVVGSEEFIVKYQKLICDYVGIKPSSVQKLGKVVCFEYTGDKAVSVGNFLYKGHKRCLNRKYKRFQCLSKEWQDIVPKKLGRPKRDKLRAA